MSKVNTFHRLADMIEEARRRKKKEAIKADKKEAPQVYSFINPFHNI